MNNRNNQTSKYLTNNEGLTHTFHKDIKLFKTKTYTPKGTFTL